MARYVDSTEQLVVELFVRDLRRSIAFYSSLGFDLLYEKETFASLVWEDHRLFLDQRDGLPEPPAVPTMNVRVMVPDVDAVWRHVSAAGLRVVAPIADRPYGLRDFTIADPDGFGVRFGEPAAGRNGMTEEDLHESFDKPRLDSRLRWHCEPGRWAVDPAGLLRVEPEGGTDFWRKTHYGFEVDNGHLLFAEVAGDFVLTTRVHFHPVHQYDQAGLMVRLSPSCWLKTSVEYEPDGPSRLGAVVTNHGWSDWSTQDFPADRRTVGLRIRRRGGDYLVEAALDEDWSQIRVAHLHEDREAVAAGLYACSPKGTGFVAEFDFLRIDRAAP